MIYKNTTLLVLSVIVRFTTSDYPLVSSNCFFLCYSNCTEFYKTGFSVKLSVNYRYLAKIYTVVIQLILNNILFYISWRCQEDRITNMTNSSRLSQTYNVRKYSYIHAICFSSVYNTLIIWSFTQCLSYHCDAFSL